MSLLCPCHSGQSYETCCAPFHRGQKPKTALLLMRSRFSAYALGLTDYIILTTHPNHPNREKSIEKWKKEIDDFSTFTQFLGLEILEDVEGEKVSTVTFKAILSRKGKGYSFTEKSRFEKIDDQWLYLSGEIL